MWVCIHSIIKCAGRSKSLLLVSLILHPSTHQSIHQSIHIQIWIRVLYVSHSMSLAVTGYVERQLSICVLSCGSIPDRPHLLTSSFTHSDHVFLGLPCPLMPGIARSVTDLIQVWHAVHIQSGNCELGLHLDLLGLSENIIFWEN